MESAEDRSRLEKRYSDGQPGPAIAVLKCAAGIAILFAVAAGPWIVLSAGGGSATADAGQPQVAVTSSSMAESRRVFDERRQRFEGGLENTKAALK